VETIELTIPERPTRDKLPRGVWMSSEATTHAALLAGAARGDVAAFTALFAEFAPRVRAWLARGLDASRADEITQEVMVRVWRNAASYDPRRGAVSTWVFTIARNARVDALRAGRLMVDETDPCFVADPGGTPETAASAAERDRTVSEALAELPAEQAEVLRSAYYGALTLREIAEAGAIPLGTVKSRVRLALERLRIRLAPWGDEE
jgi:RNA polymerase sigma-70 factor (ECF subfamily)